MNIEYISDQFIPSSTADTEQFVNMTAALSKITPVELMSAAYKTKNPPSLQDINDYYFTEGVFNLRFIQHLFPNMRGLEKVLFSIRSALNIKNRDDVDVVYTRNIPIVITCLLLTKQPVLFETFRPWPNRNVFANWFFKKMSVHPRFIGIVLHSQFAKKSYLKIGFSEEQLLVEHNAFKSKLFDEISSVKHEIRDELNLPRNKSIVSYTGRVRVEKGLNHFLTLAKSFPDVLFLLVGSEGEGEIEIKASQIENVVVIPMQDKGTVTRYIATSDILYIPTSLTAREQAKNTVLPLKTFIYKAGGKPIIAPDIEDIREVLRNEHNALLVEPDNGGAAVKGLKRLLEDEELRTTLGRNAKKEMDNLTWDNRAKNVLEFIENRLANLR